MQYLKIFFLEIAQNYFAAHPAPCLLVSPREQSSVGMNVDHSSSSNAEVKYEWNYTSTSHMPSWRGHRRLSPFYQVLRV